MHDARHGDRAGAVGSASAIGVGAMAFWAARDYSALGSVFPRSVGVLLMVLGATYLVIFMLGRTRRSAPVTGSMLRRAAVAATLLAWCFALEPFGFLLSSATAMAALIVVAHHDRWTPLRAALFSGGAAGVLIALVVLFQHVLLVPLP